MGPEQEWREALRSGRFLIQRARASGGYFFPPRVAEPGTGDRDWEWVEASGEGAVYSVTTVHPKPPEDAYDVILVDLAEGPRMMSRLDGGGKAWIGMKVRARIAGEAGDRLVVFDPA
jgi:uncharacterized OB-fold protein